VKYFKIGIMTSKYHSRVFTSKFRDIRNKTKFRHIRQHVLNTNTRQKA